MQQRPPGERAAATHRSWVAGIVTTRATSETPARSTRFLINQKVMCERALHYRRLSAGINDRAEARSRVTFVAPAEAFLPGQIIRRFEPRAGHIKVSLFERWLCGPLRFADTFEGARSAMRGVDWFPIVAGHESFLETADVHITTHSMVVDQAVNQDAYDRH
jgi:hypothetical protein